MINSKIIRIIPGALLCLSVIIFLISQLKLEKEWDRNIAVYPLSSALKEEVDDRCAALSDPEEVVKECSEMACERLNFFAVNSISEGKANCIGYAQLTSALINYAFKIKRLPYKAKPVVGKVYLFGVDLNGIAQRILPEKHRPFFKDHDFVEVKLDNEIMVIDSSLQDLTGLEFVSFGDANR